MSRPSQKAGIELKNIDKGVTIESSLRPGFHPSRTPNQVPTIQPRIVEAMARYKVHGRAWLMRVVTLTG